MISPLTTAIRTFGQGLAQLIWPATCWSCGRLTSPAPVSFCESCQKTLTTDAHTTCPRCSSTVGPHVNLEGGCTRCRDDHFDFDAAVRLGPYEGLLRELILRMKNDEAIAEAMSGLGACHIARRLTIKPDLVIPVPLHWRRHWWRGYNQSVVLGRALANQLGIVCCSRYLRRWRATERQIHQSPPARRENVRGAFAARGTLPIQGRTVLLVDDVLTTGSTASEAARALRPFKPARIIVAVLAHGR